MRINLKLPLAAFVVLLVLVSCQDASGEIFDGISGTVADSSGDPISSATVVLSSEDDYSTISSQSAVTTLTNSAGNYAFEQVGAGTYNITVSTGDGRGSFRASITFTGEGKLTVNLEVSPVGAISGEAVIESKPNDSGGIDVYVPGTSFIAKTNDNGAFVISGVPAGSYDLTAQLVGYPKATAIDVVVESGMTTVLPSPLVLKSEEPNEPDPDEPDPPAVPKGRVSGTVVLIGATGAESAIPLARHVEAGDNSYPSVASITERPSGSSLDETTLDFVPGELVVRYVDEGFQASAVPAFEAAGKTFRLERALAAAGMRLYEAPGLSRAETLAAARALNARPDVLYAFPNYIYQPAAVPDDPEYDRQWHYDAINMEAAWDITTGDSNVVVAVLDSGVIDTHPDFGNRLLPGYDFILNAGSAGDGDGRDSDPYDAIDDGLGYHGTHVAGTIGAATGNGVGVAGVDWRAKILPVRVLGAGGGTFADITDALIWAVGGPVSGVPSNGNPADVINLSLGGEQSCSQPWQDVFDSVTPFAIVIAAAGNDNLSASEFVPANCNGLITVGATDFAGERSYYSNFGSAVDVMAPGGDLTEKLFDPPRLDGVLSLGYDGSADYVHMQGTSMAAPHVTGVVALMRALDPSIDTVRALAALRASATPLSDSGCDGPGAPRELLTEDCGAGLIDAALALEFIESGELPTPDGDIAFSPTTLNLGQSADQETYTITNVGGAPVDWSIVGYDDAVDNPAPVVNGSVLSSSVSGQLGPGESQEFTLFLERDLLTADGYYRIWLEFEVEGQPDHGYQVDFQRVKPPAQLSGPMVVAAYKEDETGNLVTSGEQQNSGVITSFSFEVEPGLNLLGAWSDENDNDLVDDGDFVGFLSDFVNVPSGLEVNDITIQVAPVLGGPSSVAVELARLLATP